MPAEDAANRLEHGNAFPYDAPDEWWQQAGEPIPPPAIDWAHKAARGILADLNDRRAIKRGFEGIDEAIRAEITETMAAIIRLAAASRR
jgi:hypothetical protein